VTNAITNGILEFTKQQLHQRWVACATGLVLGLAILLCVNSISTYRWVSKPIPIEQAPSEIIHLPIAARPAVFSSVHHDRAEWSLRRALLINTLAATALLLVLASLTLRRRA